MNKFRRRLQLYLRLRDTHPAQWFVLLCAILCAAAVSVVTNLAPWQAASWTWFAIAVVLTGLLSLCKIRLSLPSQVVSLDAAPICFAQIVLGRESVLLGIGAAATCAATGALVGTFLNRRMDPVTRRRAPVSLEKAVFNVSNCALSAIGAGLACGGTQAALTALLGGRTPMDAAVRPAALLIPLLAVWVISYFVINTIGVAAVISLGRKEHVVCLWKKHCLWTWPGYLGAAALAGVMFALERQGPGWALLPLPLLYCAHKAIKEQAARLQEGEESLRKLNRTMESVMASLASTIEAKDTETRLHVHRVQTIALTLARAAGVGEADLEAVRLGALVHDVGKIAVPDGILTKPDKLTPEEFAKMQEHVIIGALILEPVPFGGPVVEAVRSHHERWDGNGYPDQLKGNQIPLSGRIIAIADVFDALTSDRPYRKAIPWDRAVEIMKRESGSHFDPMLLERFCEVLPEIRTGLEALEQSEDAAADSDVPGHLRALPGRVFDQIARAGQDSLLGAFQFVEQIVRDQSPENLTAALLQLRVHVPWDAAVVYDLDREREELRPRIALGLHETELHRVRIRLDEGISGRVASTGSPLVNKPAIRDIGAVLDVSENVELTSTLSVPVLHRDQIISVLTLYASAHAIYRDEHLRLLEAVARQLGHEWADRAVVNDLGPVALDPATGVHSVRALVERLEQELPISQQAERMLALVYLDLRQPWRSAQRQQLGLGDRLVEPITQALRECVRKEDMICRAGEAEFLLLLANAGSHDAAAFTRRASLAVEAVLDQFEISADFRTGTALFPHDGKSFAGLRAAAEAACETWRTEARAVAA